MREATVAEVAITDWESSIVFVLKKEGSIHFCVDYRRLSAVTEHDSYPIPGISECIDSIGKAQIFSTFDTNLEN